MQVRAKLRVGAITLMEKWGHKPDGSYGGVGESRRFEAQAVVGNDNKKWAEATPCGSLTLTIDNEEAAKFFRPGQFVYVDISEAPEKDPA